MHQVTGGSVDLDSIKPSLLTADRNIAEFGYYRLNLIDPHFPRHLVMVVHFRIDADGR